MAEQEAGHPQFEDAQILRRAAEVYLSWCPGHPPDKPCPRQEVADVLRQQADELEPPATPTPEADDG